MEKHVSENGDKHIASRTVRELPQHFRSTVNANLTRAKRLWSARDDYSNQDGGMTTQGMTTSITRVTRTGPKRSRLKARVGRRRRRQAWVEAFHIELREEFDRLRKVGEKFNQTTLRHLALDILKNSGTEAYSWNMQGPRSQVPLQLKIDQRWIQTFAERFRIVSRSQKGKHLLSPGEEAHIEVEVAAHLGMLCGLLTCGRVDEDDLGNADETHFIINVENGKTLGFVGSGEVKYADVVSGGESFTTMVCLSGRRDACIEPPFLVFTNKNRSYPIRGTPDDVAGVAYRTGPKGWMDTQVLSQWLSEERKMKPLENGRRRILLVDNCNGHNETEAMRSSASRIRTEIRYFLPNATHLIQPCDSFVIQKIKRAWTTHWETYKMV